MSTARQISLILCQDACTSGPTHLSPQFRPGPVGGTSSQLTPWPSPLAHSVAMPLCLLPPCTAVLLSIFMPWFPASAHRLDASNPVAPRRACGCHASMAHLRKCTASRVAVTHGPRASVLALSPAHTSIQLRTCKAGVGKTGFGWV